VSRILVNSEIATPVGNVQPMSVIGTADFGIKREMSALGSDIHNE